MPRRVFICRSARAHLRSRHEAVETRPDCRANRFWFADRHRFQRKTANTRGQAKPMPAKMTIADLEKLRWIEGTWRGTGGGVEPFFERYRFENATTLAVDGFDNEKLQKVTDTALCVMS